MIDNTDPLHSHIETTAEVVAAYVSRNSVPLAELPNLIRSVHDSLATLGTAPTPEASAEPLKPAVPVKKSVTEDYIVSLEDGRKFKSLKRHLATEYGLTPTEYRTKWGLPADYPMVAPSYAASRSALAKEMQLGRKRVRAAPEPAPQPQPEAAAPASKRGGRK